MAAVANGEKSTEVSGMAAHVNWLKSVVWQWLFPQSESKKASENKPKVYIPWDMWNQRLDMGDPDELHQYTIFLKIPKSGPPLNYVKWYSSVMPKGTAPWYLSFFLSFIPMNKPRIIAVWKPREHASFQAMLTPRQMLELMKSPEFDSFGDDECDMQWS